MPTEFNQKQALALASNQGIAILKMANAEASTKVDDPKHWNRCTIYGGAKYDKEVVLDTILKTTYSTSCLMFPCLYQIEGEDSFFLFRFGKQFVRNVMNSQYVLTDPTRTIDDQIEVSIVFEYLTTEEEPYDPFKNVEQVLAKRANVKQGVVDLRNLQNDTDLKNVYVSFYLPSLMDFIGAFIKKNFHNHSLNGLIMSYNNLESLELLQFMKKYYGTIGTLDIRHNKITYSGFEKFPHFLVVKHLLIEGNPLCDDYESAGEMISEISGKVNLEYLDNVNVSQVVQFPKKRANFKIFMRNSAYADLVDHFLHHYFTLLENDRDKLIHTYHKNASFSVSVYRNEASSYSVPEYFVSTNRNIMSMSDVTKTYDNIFIGKFRIIEALKAMPKMQFDFHTFSVDVPVTAKGELVVISSTGCFVLADDDTGRKYSLSRICILCPLRNGLGEWLILNDMWTVMSVTPKAYPDFSIARKRKVTSDFAVMLNPFLKDKPILISAVSNLTNLKVAWVEKLLSESGWDLEMTLLAFTDQFKANLIPADAFSSRELTDK